MELRRLGRTALRVSELCLGTMNFGPLTTPDDSFEIMDHALELGINFFDTANRYGGPKGPGTTETIIGNWFAQGGGRRQKVVLATKIGMEMAPDKKGLAKAYIVKGVEDSLKRLKTDRIDLYQSHRDDPATPVAETLEAYRTLIEAGRLGEALDAAKTKGLPRYVTLQPHYSLIEREGFEKDLVQLCL